MVARFDAVRLFVLTLWTLQPHFTLWLSAPTLYSVGSFEGVCMPQHIRDLPGLDQG